MNRANLQTLATFLAYDPRGVDFDMSVYTDSPGWCEEDMADCGTVGCAVGHAAFVFEKRIGERWDNFSCRVLEFDLATARDSRLWDWCFSANWHSYDNSRKGAAQRIQYLLDVGVPDKWRVSHKSVALYLHTEVHRPDNDSKALIRNLLDRISREPRFATIETTTETPQLTEVTK